MIYKHLLAAIETHDEGEKMLVKARDLARGFGASLSLIHVVEYLPIDPAGDALLATPIDLCSSARRIRRPKGVPPASWDRCSRPESGRCPAAP